MLTDIGDTYVRNMMYKGWLSSTDQHQSLRHITSTIIMKATPKVSTNTKAQIKLTEVCLSKACNQMQQLLAKISEVKTRHQRALKHNQADRCRQLKMQLQILQGMYNVFHQYGDHKARQMAVLYTTPDSTTDQHQ